MSPVVNPDHSQPEERGPKVVFPYVKDVSQSAYTGFRDFRPKLTSADSVEEPAPPPEIAREIADEYSDSDDESETEGLDPTVVLQEELPMGLEDLQISSSEPTSNGKNTLSVDTPHPGTRPTPILSFPGNPKPASLQNGSVASVPFTKNAENTQTVPIPDMAFGQGK